MDELFEREPEKHEQRDPQSGTFELLLEMLRSAASDQPLFPPTLIYNEGWFLRLILDLFTMDSVQDYPLTLADGARWFSEALMPSAFLARYRGDNLAENWTHADGVVGHFRIGEEGKTDLILLPKATQFLVLEAKMFSHLSAGVTKARYYDQAARTVACMAEVLRRAERHPSKIPNLGFYVLAPSSQIENGVFSNAVRKESIYEKVKRRVQAYDGEKNRWFEEWFRPTWENIKIDCLSWERAASAIQEQDHTAGKSIKQFYLNCLQFNQ